MLALDACRKTAALRRDFSVPLDDTDALEACDVFVIRELRWDKPCCTVGRNVVVGALAVARSRRLPLPPTECPLAARLGGVLRVGMAASVQSERRHRRHYG